jgi:hypothetical protein
VWLCKKVDLKLSTWGRYYDHNFLRFSTIFGEKIGVFLKNQCYDQNFAYLSFVLSQKRQFFRWIFRRKYFKNHNIGPCTTWHTKLVSILILIVRRDFHQKMSGCVNRSKLPTWSCSSWRWAPQRGSSPSRRWSRKTCGHFVISDLGDFDHFWAISNTFGRLRTLLGDFEHFWVISITFGRKFWLVGIFTCNAMIAYIFYLRKFRYCGSK